MFDRATGNYTSLADTGYTEQQLSSWLSTTAAKYGVSPEPGDLSSLKSKLMGGSGYIRELGGDPAKAFAEFESQYQRRGGSQTTGSGVDSSTLNVGTTRTALINVTPSATAPAPATVGTAASLGTTALAVSGPNTLAGLMTPAGGAYATGAYGSAPAYASGPSVSLSSPFMGTPGAAGGLDTTTLLILAAIGIGAYFLIK